ncbi:MAG TPA: pyruvate dehydrogenase complex dihydrolipoamide acetyltransferase [Stellaceae bacterium]|nr:pyruvate dehydrogenase complex dihydrolipoamide acetyltransferase [Stellaceae bacterium]
MPIEIRMPALSPTMTEGNLARWLKKEGDEVHSGDVIAEIETDKAMMEYEAADEGRLGKIIVPEGAQGVKVNEPIALLLEEGEDASSLEGHADAAPAVEPAPREEARPESPAPPEPKTEPAPAPVARPAAAAAASVATAAAPAPQPRENGRVFASPLARRMAHHAGINLAAIRGSGPQGRVVKADIDRALSNGTVATAAHAAPDARAPDARAPGLPRPAPPAPPPTSLDGAPHFTEKPHSSMRRVIARRLTEAKQTVPHFYMTVDCEIDELLRIRKVLNAADEALNVSVNDFVIRAAGLALRQVPAANASWSDDAIILWERADIAMAVALEDGLITPIIKGADGKGLAQIAAETKDLAARARSGKLKLDEFQGGTFSISNLGMYGIREFAAVINPPHGCILAVGSGMPRPVVKDGQLAVATVMSCTLSADHRVVDGAVGAQFLGVFKRLIDEPARMLL